MTTLDLSRAVTRWLGDGKAQGWSPKTLKDREETMKRFCWWLEREEGVVPTLAALQPAAIRTFLAYARAANPNGRFGSNRESAKREARPATVNAYYRILRAFTNFCLDEGLLDETPLKNVKAPRTPTDRIQPLNDEQLQQLLDAARRTTTPVRNVAVILMLVDTGMRCAELMGLKMTDVDRGTGEMTVLGKGNKRRTVFMGVACRRALWRYLEDERVAAEPDEPLFILQRHRTNPVEKVWGELKAEQMANVMHPSRDAIYTFLAGFTGARALRLTAQQAHEQAAHQEMLPLVA